MMSPSRPWLTVSARSKEGLHCDNPEIIGPALGEDGGIVVVRDAGHARLGVGLGAGGEVDRLAAAIDDGLPYAVEDTRDTGRGSSLLCITLPESTSETLSEAVRVLTVLLPPTDTGQCTRAQVRD